MSEKNGFLQKAEKFLSGKGFYIVLFACALVVGASAWILFGTSGAEEATIKEAKVNSAREQSDSYASVPSKDPQVSVIAPEPDTKDSDASETIAEAPEELTFVWPVSGRLERPYSADALIYSKTMADWRTHDGVDIASEPGESVMAAADGVVSEVFNDDMFGTTVKIDHGNGIVSIYSNLAESPSVSEGDSVAMCAVIGSVGDTALEEAVETSHLHFAMTVDGVPTDPADFLPAR